MKINKKAKIFNRYLKIYEKAANINDHDQCIDALIEIIKIEPNNFAALNELGTIFIKVGKYEDALHFHLKAAELAPNNPIVLGNVGLDYFKLDDFNNAKIFLDFALNLDQKNLDLYLILANIYHSNGFYNELIKLTTKALIIWPEDFQLHNMLAAGLIGLNILDEAIYSCETALILNPNSIEAKLNLAMINEQQGNSAKAISICESIIQDKQYEGNELISQIKYNLSYSYLNVGRLEEGWKYYEFGLDQKIPKNMRRRPTRKFSEKQWEGEDLGENVLLVWTEQGLGDEILFISLIPELMKKVKNIILECDSRLVPTVTRSFPSIICRKHEFNIRGESLNCDFSYHTPIGSLTKFFRRQLLDFTNHQPYLIPLNIAPTEFMTYFKNERKAGKIIIGICWRSGLLSRDRTDNYLPLTDWGSIFKIKNATFLNLQYGECEDEIIEAERIFNIKINRWPNIDLKNDLDSVFAMIKKIDFVVTAATAVSPMSFSIGTQTLTFQPTYSWTNLGTNYYPWSKFMHPFVPKPKAPFKTVLDDISNYIENR